jgi:hypothetical protein
LQKYLQFSTQSKTSIPNERETELHARLQKADTDIQVLKTMNKDVLQMNVANEMTI